MSENPDVPAPVPENVPAGDSSGRPSAGVTARARTPSYLTGDPTRWRFQMRVPARLHAADSFLAKSKAKINATLGSGPRRDAERTAQRLASICEAVFAEAKRLMEQGMTMHMNDPETTLVEQVVEACKAGIDKALERPEDALTFAAALQSALKSLTLVAEECAKGEAGMPAVVGAADTISREAIEMVLGYAKDPEKARAALAALQRVAPKPFAGGEETGSVSSLAIAVASARTAPPPRPSDKPTFGEISSSYIEVRKAQLGEKHAEIKSLEQRRATFIGLAGDKPVDTYTPMDLQNYVNDMRYWPANATKRAAFKGMSVREIIDANRDCKLQPLRLKSLQDGYVADVKTMMAYGEPHYGYRSPFAGFTPMWPKLTPSRPREGIDHAVLGRVFTLGVETGRLAEAMLLLLALLTTRRLGLLIYLQGSDIRFKHGHWVAQVDGMVQLDDGTWSTAPIKTAESLSFFVLHDFLVQIGFVKWACKQDGFIFKALHEHPDPERYASKVMNRLLREAGAKGENIEVFHSLRGDGIDLVREADIAVRAHRLQAGHALVVDEHDGYGRRALKREEVDEIATGRLPDAVDLSVFKDLNFDDLAAARPKRGRRPKKI